jgi:hypothetical protein
MDVTNTAPSATFNLDADATPASFHRFLRSQPDSSHVTMEFKTPRNKQKIPVVRVVHSGEREEFVNESRTALTSKLAQWNEDLLGQPGCSDAARMLNLMLSKESLSLDVSELEPALGKMSDAYHALHPNMYVKAWNQNADKVSRILVTDDSGFSETQREKDRNAIDYARRIVARFDDGGAAEIDAAELLKDAWHIGFQISPDDQQMLQTAWRLLKNKMKDPELERIIGPEVLDLLALCREARGKEWHAFSASEDSKNAVFRIVNALKGRSLDESTMPGSSAVTPIRPRSASAATPVMPKPGADSVEHRSRSHHGQQKPKIPSIGLTLSTPPRLHSAPVHGAAPASGGKQATPPKSGDDKLLREVSTSSKKTTPPKSPRSTDGAGDSGKKTVQEKHKKERPSLRKARTDKDEAANDTGSPYKKALETSAKASASTPGSEAVSDKKRSKLKRGGTMAEKRSAKEDDAPPRKSKRKSDAKPASGKSSKMSSQESRAERESKSGRALPRKSRQRASEGRKLTPTDAATSTAGGTPARAPLSTMETARSVKHRPKYASQPTSLVEMETAFEKFRAEGGGGVLPSAIKKNQQGKPVPPSFATAANPFLPSSARTGDADD